MLSISEFTFSMEKFRRGQLGAFEVTTKRIMQDREKHTAIVLPTRYGKTDFMLMSGLYLMEQKAVSGMLIMTPNQVLRNQAVDTAKLHKSLSRYGVSVERVLSDGRKRPGVDPYNIDAGSGARIEFMLDRVPNAVTTSMVMYNPGVFRHWIDHLQQAAGVPPVVFVDEAHTASNQSTWGQVIQHLGEAGAYIVLCTATPYRSDGLPIPGFEVTKHYEDELTRRDQVGAHFYQLHGRRVVYRLEAHHVTTFQEAWQESVLCGVTRETFDVNLREHGFDGYAEQWLSELPEHEARRALSRAIRSPIVIRDGVRKLLSNLRTRQKDAPETAGIVFVGNDIPNDESEDVEANEYANRVVEAIRAECAASSTERSLKVVIATSSIGDAPRVISEFTNGKGDILVVKMMASAGLDIDRLKVALDLSTVRTAGSYVQRAMRICTRWDRDNRAPILKALYITPDDIMGRELYQRLIHDLGGDASTVEWEQGGPVDDGLPPPIPPPLTEYEVVGTGLGNTLEDEDGSVGPGTLLHVVDDLMNDLPGTTREMGKGKMSSRLYEAVQQAIGVNAESHSPAPETPDTPPTPTDPADPENTLVDNTQHRMTLKRKRVVQLVKQDAARILREDSGPNFSKDRLGTEINDTWTWLYDVEKVHWPRGMKSGQLLGSLDETTLDRLIGRLEVAINAATH